ncbi:MAG TPA: sigma 54-interacting transcriptional regulator, partial [Polyangiaceae bacterium]|nr:sigma 54-interacting transcriptional regulator [Polyangiaceae bacterium]
SVFLLLHDIRAYRSATIEFIGNTIVGPLLRPVIERTQRIGRAAQDVHLTGETGVGKEIFARLYHAASPLAAGPFLAVNCATIQKELAEATLFGSKRGAYTGAHADQPGLFRSADGGTLFLDELGELDLSLQAKLLRVLELREVTPVGSTQPQAIRVQVCSATLRDLRERVRLGQFREDLYFRLARPSVAIPALRDRREEIAYLAHQAATGVSQNLRLTPVLVEAAVSRPWPGNVRELLAAVRDGAHAALEEGSAHVKLSHLDPGAGLGFDLGTSNSPKPPHALASAPVRSVDATTEPGQNPDLRAKVEDRLRRTAGNVSRTARLLGWHRTQLRRYLEREGIDPQTFSGMTDETD